MRMPAPHVNKPPVSAASGEFGRRVRERRLELGLSQERLAPLQFQSFEPCHDHLFSTIQKYGRTQQMGEGKALQGRD